LNLDGGENNSIQIQLEDLQLQHSIGTSKVTAVTLGQLSKYSTFRNVRLYGFKRGIHFARSLAGPMGMYNVSIRGMEQSAVSTYGRVGKGITDVLWFGGIIDNNGQAGKRDGRRYPVFDLYDCRKWVFFGTVIEGNFAGGFRVVSGGNIAFYSARLEETRQKESDGTRNVHEFNAGDVTFVNCVLAYRSQADDESVPTKLGTFAGGRVKIIGGKIVNAAKGDGKHNPLPARYDVSCHDVEFIGCEPGNRVLRISTANGVWVADRHGRKSKDVILSGTAELDSMDIDTLRLSSRSPCSVTGIAAPHHFCAQELTLINVGGAHIVFQHLGPVRTTSQIVTTRGTDVILGTQKTLKLWYDDSDLKWRVTGGTANG
jgi:hypothetical protein